jgi:hypothetical protein
MHSTVVVFTRTVGANQSHHLAGGHVEINAVDNPSTAVALLQAPDHHDPLRAHT